MFRLVYPLIALAIVHVGNDNTLTELVRNPTYYSDIVLSLLLTFSAGWYFRRYYRHHAPPVAGPDGAEAGRVGEYLLSVLVIPVLILSTLEAFYVGVILDIPFREVTILYLELPLIVLFCLLINAAYLVMGLRGEVQQVRTGVTHAGPAYRTHFVVHAGAASRSIAAEEVAYFRVVDKITYLVQVDGSQSLLNLPLREVEECTDPAVFYPLNRQLVAHRQSVCEYERTDTRKLLVRLSPPTGTEQFVSKLKATAFLRWLKGERLTAE